MIKALLFDLDGTLLNIDMDLFLPEYFKALAPKFADLAEPKAFVDKLMSSTMKMIGNSDPSKTNKDVFIEDFTARLGLPAEILMPRFDRFYANDFNNLSSLAKMKPVAKELVRWAGERGLDLVVATNPVFPKEAILARLRWAGLEDVDWRLVTSYEVMHYCKPSTSYYLEILEYIGREPEECLMAGNDVLEDLAAGKVGIRTFFVDDLPVTHGLAEYKCDYSGGLDDLFKVVRALCDAA